MDQDATASSAAHQLAPLVDLNGGSPIVQLVDQIVDRCVEVSRTSERLRLLLRENEAIAEELALPALHRRVAEAATHLVPTPAAALAVVTPDGAVGQLVQHDSEDED